MPDKTPSKSTVPHVAEGSAVKVRSSIIKHFGGEARKRWGDSNPYSDTQAVDVRIPASHHKALIAHLEHPDHGWKKDHSWFNDSFKGHNFVKGHNSITVHENEHGHHHVTITGKKKAKLSSIPYYD